MSSFNKLKALLQIPQDPAQAEALKKKNMQLMQDEMSGLSKRSQGIDLSEGEAEQVAAVDKAVKDAGDTASGFAGSIKKVAMNPVQKALAKLGVSEEVAKNTFKKFKSGEELSAAEEMILQESGVAAGMLKPTGVIRTKAGAVKAVPDPVIPASPSKTAADPDFIKIYGNKGDRMQQVMDTADTVEKEMLSGIKKMTPEQEAFEMEKAMRRHAVSADIKKSTGQKLTPEEEAALPYFEKTRKIMVGNK